MSGESEGKDWKKLREEWRRLLRDEGKKAIYSVWVEAGADER